MDKKNLAEEAVRWETNNCGKSLAKCPERSKEAINEDVDMDDWDYWADHNDVNH